MNTRIRHADDPTSSRSHLRVCDQAFAVLSCSPAGWTLDCTVLAGVPGARLGLPAGEVALPRLRDWMLQHRDNYPARDAIWRELITRARAIGGDWCVAAVGMAMPALVRMAGDLTRGYSGDPADVDNEILAGFLAALRRVDLAEDRLYSKLCWAGYRAGYATRHADAAVVCLDELSGATGGAPNLPYRHVDLLLARAVTLQVLDVDEANLILATRLEHRSIQQFAAAAGIDAAALRMRRRRAEVRLVDAVVQGLLSGGLVSPATRARLAADAARRSRARAHSEAAGDLTAAA